MSQKYKDQSRVLVTDVLGNKQPEWFVNDKFYQAAMNVPPDKLPMLEVFRTIEGEGLHVGTPRVLVRCAGCAVGCVWCDTPHSWSLVKSKLTSLNALEKEIDAKANGFAQEISFTGGEMMHYPRQVIELAERLRRRRYILSLETSGMIINHDVFMQFNYLSLDIKTPSSGVLVFEELIKEYLHIRETYEGAQFKCVITNAEDLKWVEDNLRPMYVTGHMKTNPLVLTPGVMNTAKSIKQQELNTKLHEVMQMIVDWNRQYNIRVVPQIHQLLRFD